MSELVKHYQHTMQGAPQLSNIWGSMISVLDTLLVTGFNFKSVLGVSKESTESLTATISVASEHGFIARQVVRIKDSTNGWNGDYKVLSVSTSSIVVECLASHPTTISGTAQVFTSPLDWEIVFSTSAGSTEPKRAYRSTHPDSLGLILLVHDFCVSGAAATGAKFAKVAMVSSMSDINTITGAQVPYDSAAPNANWGWDGTYHGWAKWYYCLANGIGGNTNVRDSAIPSLTTIGYNVVGTNAEGFVLEAVGVAMQGGTLVHTTYGFFDFFDNILSGRNAALLCFGLPTKVRQEESYALYVRGSLSMQGTTSTVYNPVAGMIKGAIWFNAGGAAAASQSFGAIPHLDFANTAQLLFSDFILVDANNIPRGLAPFLRTTHITATSEGVDSDFGKYRNSYCLHTGGNNNAKFGLLMEKL